MNKVSDIFTSTDGRVVILRIYNKDGTHRDTEIRSDGQAKSRLEESFRIDVDDRIDIKNLCINETPTEKMPSYQTAKVDLSRFFMPGTPNQNENLSGADLIVDIVLKDLKRSGPVANALKSIACSKCGKAR